MRYDQNEYSYKCTWLRVQFPSNVNQIRDASRVGYVDQNASNGGRFTIIQTGTPTVIQGQISQTLRNISQYMAVETFESMSRPL